MKRNKSRNHQKRRENKRANRKKRKNRKKNEPGIEWITDTMFSIHFDDKRIHNLFPSITIEVVDEDYEVPYEDDQTQEDHRQPEIYEINNIYTDEKELKNNKN